MKGRNSVYLSGLLLLIMLTSCVSYETTASSKSKKHNSDRYTYNTKSNKNTAKSTSPKKKNPGTLAVKSKNTNVSKSADVKLVLKEAEKYKGTPYKYGGNTSSGIDCSGLVCNAYQTIDVSLPRRSIDMSNEGSVVSVSNVKEGDLLFFATGGGSINHVGIVYSINGSGEINFIHASTSKGVTISSLEETYWKGKFIKAKRIL